MRAGGGFAALACLAALASAHDLRAADASGAGKALVDEAIQPGVDYHTFANVADFRVRHVDLDLAVDFTAHRLSGRADLTDVAYEKGKLFLQFLESRFGREALDAFLHRSAERNSCRT